MIQDKASMVKQRPNMTVTLAAEIVSRETSKEFIYMGKYSQTTTRHQKEFFKQNDLTDKRINKRGLANNR